MNKHTCLIVVFIVCAVLFFWSRTPFLLSEFIYEPTDVSFVSKQDRNEAMISLPDYCFFEKKTYMDSVFVFNFVKKDDRFLTLNDNVRLSIDKYKQFNYLILQVGFADLSSFSRWVFVRTGTGSCLLDYVKEYERAKGI